ncbi:methylamine utilization protein MauJ [Bhargavaea cecembensis]|uniref:methylamine utilization protein MauJ n=1 Tax=Bhargavaea cecembensis TaxID=394098 RepID=UPI001267CE2D|nr:methylamine utilization protein MauJ [Bhargavaea cecembensis]
MNYVEYYTDVENLNPVTFKVNHNEDYITEINIIIEEETLPPKNKMTIHLKLQSNITSTEKALESTLTTAKNLINLLTYKTGGKFGSLRRGCYSINGKGVLGIGEITLYNFETTDLPQWISQSLELGLKDNNLLANLKTNDYHRLYREAMQTNDVIARYMFLYGIVYHVQNSSQDKVDSYIRRLNPSIEERTSTNPRTPNKQITIYTWLRNEIGHTTGNTDINMVKHEINEVCDTFAQLVKDAI